MSKTKNFKHWLVLDWKSGDSRTRKNKPRSGELGTNEILAELQIDVEVPEVDVPTLAVQIDVPEPQVYQATMEALDDEDLPDWSESANDVLQDHKDDILTTDWPELGSLIDQMTTQVLMDAPGRPPVDQVRDYLSQTASQLRDDHPEPEA